LLGERDVFKRDGEGEVLVRALVLEVLPGVLGTLVRDQLVTVGGTSYRVLWRAAGVAGPFECWAVRPA
jgi:hypothetical protein